MTATTTHVRAFAPGVTARIVYTEEDLPTLSSGQQHVLLELGDHLGSTTIVLDQATGELAEHRSYQAYGETDSHYRPTRWGAQREPYGFTGKEADIEVGLVYFGARYYAPALGRWVSADPATIHELRSDPNPYAYVSGRIVVAKDPDGRLAFLAVVGIGAAIGAAVGALTNLCAQAGNHEVNGLSVAVAAGVGALAGAAFGAVVSMGGVTAISAAMHAGSTAAAVGAEATAGGASVTAAVGPGTAIAGGFVATAGLVTPATTVVGTTVAGARGRDPLGTLRYAGHGFEAGLVMSLGAAVAYATGAGATGLLGVGGSWKTGLVASMTYNAGLNGAFAGARGTYDWLGWGAPVFAADSSWGILGTSLGNAVNVTNAVGGADYASDLSERSNAQIYWNGFPYSDRFAHTQGNVVSNIRVGANGRRARKGDGLVRHELVHVLQNRVGGPVYQATYVGWLAAMAPVGWITGAARGEDGWGMWLGYYDNPWEIWAYDENFRAGKWANAPYAPGREDR